MSYRVYEPAHIKSRHEFKQAKPVWEAAPLPAVSDFQTASRTPSEARYRSMLIQEAQRAGIDPELVLGRQRTRPLCYARFRVWRALRLQGFSLPGIGRVANRDHGTVYCGIRRISALEPEAEQR